MSKYRQSCSMTSSSICLHDSWLSRLSGPNQLEVLPSWRARTALGVSLPHPQSSSLCLRSHSRARCVLTSAATRCAVGRGSETNKHHIQISYVLLSMQHCHQWHSSLSFSVCLCSFIADTTLSTQQINSNSGTLFFPVAST